MGPGRGRLGERARRAVEVAIWLAIAAGAAWAAVRLFGLERGFPLVPLVAYTPYVALGAVLPLAVALLLRRWAAAAAAAALLAVLAIVVVPRGISDAPAAEAGGRRLTVMTANLKLGEANAQRVVELVRGEGVDVLGVQELTPGAARRLRAGGLAKLLPEESLEPIRGSAGSGLYGRRPLHPLPSLHRAGGFAMRRARVRLPGLGATELVSAHPRPPTNGTEVAAWAEELRSLPDADPDGAPRILLGDFNATLDHVELRDLIDTGYTDAAAATGEGLATTWPVGRVLPPPVTIDHVLVDERIGVIDARVLDLPDSDHRAIVAELSLPE